jgi:preprotein translocase subunit SecG
MFNPQTITFIFFIVLLIILLFYNNKKKSTYNQENFNIKRDILSKVDVFTKHMLLNNYT